MDSTCAPQPRAPRVPVGLRAPFSGRTWREFLFLLLGLPLSVVMFGYAVAVTSLGAGLLITFLGFPLLAGGLAGCRALGVVERGLARALLGVRIAGPGPVRATRPGATGWMTAVLRSGASWRHLLHTFLRFPWALFAFVVSVTLWATGWALLAYPLWRWTFVAYLGRPGIQVWGGRPGQRQVPRHAVGGGGHQRGRPGSRTGDTVGDPRFDAGRPGDGPRPAQCLTSRRLTLPARPARIDGSPCPASGIGAPGAPPLPRSAAGAA